METQLKKTERNRVLNYKFLLIFVFSIGLIMANVASGAVNGEGKCHFKIWEAHTTDSVWRFRMYENEGLLNVFFSKRSNKTFYSFCIDLRYHYFEHPEDSLLSKQSLYQELLQNSTEIDSIVGKHSSIGQVKLFKKIELEQFTVPKFRGEIYDFNSIKYKHRKTEIFLFEKGYLMQESDYVTHCSSCSPNGFMKGSYPISRFMKNTILDSIKQLVKNSPAYFSQNVICEFRYVFQNDSLGNVKSIVPKALDREGIIGKKLFGLVSLITKVNPYYFYENAYKNKFNVVDYSSEFEMRIFIRGSDIKIRYYYKNTRAVETIYGDVER